MKKIIITLFQIVLLCGLAGSLQAEEYTVTKTADTNDDVCNSDCSLREAVAKLNKNKNDDEWFEIILPSGEFDISSLGKLTLSPVTDEDDPEVEIHITGSGIDQTIISANNLCRIFDFIYQDYNSFSIYLNDLTIKNGYSLSNGGAINILDADSLFLDNVKFENNNSALNGGAIHVHGAYEAELSNSIFMGNSAANGGAIYFDFGDHYNALDGSFINLKFENNAAFSGNGGAVNYGLFSDDNYGETCDYINSLFINNQATNGGAIFSDNSYLNISFSTFYNNSAEQGNAIYNNEAEINLYANIIDSNNEKVNCGNNITTIYSAGYNLENRNDCNLVNPTDMINTDPLLDESAKLTSLSPAINKINYSECLDYYSMDRNTLSNAGEGSYSHYFIRYDLDRRLRIDNCDIGSYEYWPDLLLTVTSVSGTGNSAVVQYSDQTEKVFPLFASNIQQSVFVKQYNNNVGIAISPFGKKIKVFNLYDGAIYDTDLFSKKRRKDWLLANFDTEYSRYFAAVGKNKNSLLIYIIYVNTDFLQLSKRDVLLLPIKNVSLKKSFINDKVLTINNKKGKTVAKYNLFPSVYKIEKLHIHF